MKTHACLWSKRRSVIFVSGTCLLVLERVIFGSGAPSSFGEYVILVLYLVQNTGNTGKPFGKSHLHSYEIECGNSYFHGMKCPALFMAFLRLCELESESCLMSEKPMCL